MRTCCRTLATRARHAADRAGNVRALARVAALGLIAGGCGGLAFRALNPRSLDGRWAQRDAYIAGTPLIEMDPTKVPIVIRQIGDPAPLLQKIDAKIEKLGPAHRAERTIEPQDGL